MIPQICIFSHFDLVGTAAQHTPPPTFGCMPVWGPAVSCSYTLSGI